jgi:hypothetical protein
VAVYRKAERLAEARTVMEARRRLAEEAAHLRHQREPRLASAAGVTPLAGWPPSEAAERSNGVEGVPESGAPLAAEVAVGQAGIRARAWVAPADALPRGNKSGSRCKPEELPSRISGKPS